MVRTLVARSDEVADAWSTLDVTGLTISVALGAAAMWWIGRMWTSLLVARGHKVPARRAMAWYFTGQLGKYVPGGIWPVIGRSELATRGGIDRPVAYAATALSMATTYAAAALVGGMGSLVSWTYPLIGVSVLAVALTGLGFSGSPWLGTRLGRLSPRQVSLPSSATLVRLAVVHAPAWILVSLSTSVTAAAFDADIGIAHMACASSLAWLAGFLVVGVPGGIGVREAVFTALVAPSVPAGLAVSIAVASRIVFIVVDVGAAVVSGTIAGRSGLRGTSAES